MSPLSFYIIISPNLLTRPFRFYNWLLICQEGQHPSPPPAQTSPCSSFKKQQWWTGQNLPPLCTQRLPLIPHSIRYCLPVIGLLTGAFLSLKIHFRCSPVIISGFGNRIYSSPRSGLELESCFTCNCRCQVSMFVILPLFCCSII